MSYNLAAFYQAAVIPQVAWLPPPPNPTLPPLDAGIAGPTVLTRVFGGHRWLYTVLSAWEPPPPLPINPTQTRRVTPGGPPLPPPPVSGNLANPPHNVNAFGATPVYIVPNNAIGAIAPRAGAGTVVATAGSAIVAVTGPCNGGYITNPANSASQGIVTAENAYVDMVSPPGSTDALANGTTVLLIPSQSFTIPAIGSGVTIWINAATAGHKFTVVVW